MFENMNKCEFKWKLEKEMKSLTRYHVSFQVRTLYEQRKTGDQRVCGKTSDVGVNRLIWFLFFVGVLLTCFKENYLFWEKKNRFN